MNFLRILTAALLTVFFVMFYLGCFASDSLFLKAIAVGLAVSLIFGGILDFID